MSIAFQSVQGRLKKEPKTWLITGVAGFIGSNLLEALLNLGQHVTGLDNFATGHRSNIEEVRAAVGEAAWSRFTFMEGDIRDIEECHRACQGIDHVLHQAALGSVPRSVENPGVSNEVNISGFLNMLIASRDAQVKQFVYAASSSTYGDHPGLPKVEDVIGKPLSPYAVTKLVNELYADVFARTYGVQSIGLRYFNVFGPRQDPDGAYAAVIPKWISSLIHSEPVFINGDGQTSRDFCFIENVVQANLLAATTNQQDAKNTVYNVAAGQRTSLLELHDMLKELLSIEFPHLKNAQPVYRDFRRGDVRHSLADVSKANRLLGYSPTHSLHEGLKMALPWYLKKASR